MDRKEFEGLLSKVAKEVDDLVATPENHQRFIAQCKDFDGMVEKNHEAHAALQEKARETGKDVEQSVDFPVHPVLWFCLPVRDSFVTNTSIVNGVVSRGKERRPTDAERLMGRYVRLAVVHDALCGQQEDERIYFTEDQLKVFPQSMLKWDNTFSYWCSEHVRLTEAALRDVKADIDKAAKKTKKAGVVGAVNRQLSQSHLYPPLFVILPGEGSFADAWEIFCCDVLNRHEKTTEIVRRKAPEGGVDLLWRERARAYQCKSVLGPATNRFDVTKAVASIKAAIACREETGWDEFCVCSNVDITGPQEKKLRKACPGVDLKLLTPSFWLPRCREQHEHMCHRFNDLLPRSSRSGS